MTENGTEPTWQDAHRKAVEWACEYLNLKALPRSTARRYHATGSEGRYYITARWRRPDLLVYKGFELPDEERARFDRLVGVELDEDFEVEAACVLTHSDVSEFTESFSRVSDRQFIAILPLLDHIEELGERLVYRREVPDDWIAWEGARAEAQPEFIRRVRTFDGLVLGAYGHTCAACGEMGEERRILTPEGETWVQACHIIPPMEGGSDHERNGIALCPPHAWAFGVGLITLTDEGTWLTSPAVPVGPQYEFILELEEQRAHLPDPDRAPHPEALAWHREHCFVGQ